MTLTVVFLAVCASVVVASGFPDGNRDPGMVDYFTEECLAMWLREELGAKLKNTPVPDISGNVSSILWSSFGYDLQNMTVKDYKEPEVNVSITRATGIVTTYKVSTISIAGNFLINHYIGDCHQYYGNFSMLIREASVKMIRKTILASDLEIIKYESFNGTCFVKGIEFVFHDQELNDLLALIDDQQLKSLAEEYICKSYRLLTESTYDASYNFTPNIYLNKTFLGLPIIHDGYVEAPQTGEVRDTSDSEAFMELPLQMEQINPKRMKVYCLSEFLFNSYANIVHKRKLLSYTYTKSDLPEGCESLLNTSCELHCFGTLFPTAKNDHPDSTVALNVSSPEPPRVQITEEGLRVNLTLDMAAYVRGKNGSITYLFFIRQELSARVAVIMKKNRVHLKMQHPDSNIEIINSTIGQLKQDQLLPLVELSYQKVLFSACEYFGLDGLDLGIPKPFSAARSEVEMHKGYVLLMFDYSKEVNY